MICDINCTPFWVRKEGNESGDMSYSWRHQLEWEGHPCAAAVHQQDERSWSSYHSADTLQRNNQVPLLCANKRKASWRLWRPPRSTNYQNIFLHGFQVGRRFVSDLQFSHFGSWPDSTKLYQWSSDHPATTCRGGTARCRCCAPTRGTRPGGWGRLPRSTARTLHYMDFRLELSECLFPCCKGVEEIAMSMTDRLTNSLWANWSDCRRQTLSVSTVARMSVSRSSLMFLFHIILWNVGGGVLPICLKGSVYLQIFLHGCW